VQADPPIVLLVLAPPDRPGATAALARACAAAPGPGVRLVFFQGEGVLAARDVALGSAWRTLAAAHGVRLELCASSAERLGIDEDPGESAVGAFRIAGLGQLIVAGLDAPIESFP
jgi:sulfur relay (sulfurtransferase) complex TusBCD TusD component (DsrE family)